MKEKSDIAYINIWNDICFYEVYMDKISYDDYLIYLSNKYCVDIKTIIKKILETKIEAQKRIIEHHEKEKDYQPIFKTESEEERIKTVIRYNRYREEIKERVFDEKPLTLNKRMRLLKTK